MLEGNMIRIMNDKEGGHTVIVGQDIILSPSNLKNGKKDIYATDLLNRYVGYVTRTRPNGRHEIVKRDSLRAGLETFMASATHKGISLLCDVKEVQENFIIVEVISEIRTLKNVDSGKSYGINRSNLAEIKIALCNEGKQPLRHPVAFDNTPNPHRVNACNIGGELFEHLKEESKPVETAKTIVTNTENKGDDSKMMNMNMGMGNMSMDKIFGGAIGHVNDDAFKLGFDGKIAIRREDGDYITAKADGTLTNVSNFAFDMGGTFILPKKLNKVKKGDLIIRNAEVFVVKEDGRLNVVNVLTQKAEELVATKNMLLGSEFVRVITSPFSMFGGDNKMGGLMMMGMMGNQEGKGAVGGMDMSSLMMMSMMNGDKEMDMAKMMPMMMMMGGNGATGGMGGMNPMMMMSMMGGGNGMGDMFGGMFGDEDKAVVEPKEEAKTLDIEAIQKMIDEGIAKGIAKATDTNITE